MKIWLAIFGIWALLLSGLFSQLTGSPGILQAVRLRALLQSNKDQLYQVEARLSEREKYLASLKTNVFAQMREIRSVLGYAHEDELIFDFTNESFPAKKILGQPQKTQPN